MRNEEIVHLKDRNRSVRLAERWNMADEHGEFDWAEREGNMHYRSAASPYIRN